MKEWLRSAIQELSGTTSKLIFTLGGFLLLWGIFAPVTTIVWWLNHGGEELRLIEEQEPNPVASLPGNGSAKEIDCYIVFLPGVGNFSPDEIDSGEKYFIEQLAKQHSNCVVVRDVFPYSIANRDLGSQRLLTPLWEEAKNSDGWIGTVLIQLRNLWRFAIAADYRYSPVYSLGIATTIVERMNAAHPISNSEKPINLILISTSGGTQVALGSTAYLDEWLDARLTVVSIGGTFDGNTGFEHIQHMYHFQGEKDFVPTLSYLVFPSRWNWTVGSPINRANRQGRFTVCNSGAHEHSGDQGYFGTDKAENGEPYVEQMIAQVAQLPIWSIDQPLISKCPSVK
ncbi:hypothetical protein ACQ4M3_22480 [Leptolyngbya sp. AN03gr2]|uniref:hypothetical protein n=1 Tax=unclassified Leptolyngbya TaxID=2650499 RepID=UPI003D31777D